MRASTRSMRTVGDAMRWPIIGLLCSSSCPALANDAPAPPPASDPREFLRLLRTADDAHGLRTEALRVAYQAIDVDPVLQSDAAYVVGLAEHDLGRDDLARRTWWSVEAFFPDTDAAARARLAGLTLELASAPDHAGEGFARWLAEHPDHALAPNAASGVARAWVTQGEFDDALASLQSPSPSLAEALSRPRWRRPGAAAVMSLVLPGLGQVYTGGWGEAAAALTVNALFAAGSYEAARREQWGTLGVLGFFGVGFWLGNVYGAADGALRHNRRVRQRALDALSAELPDPIPGVPQEPSGVDAPPLFDLPSSNNASTGPQQHVSVSSW